MQPLLFENTTENFRESNQNHLNIECGFGLFKAIVFNPVSKKLIWACAMESTSIKNTIKELNLHETGFSQVTVNLVNPYSTLIPNQLFEETELDAYLRFNFETIDNTESHFDHLKTLEAKNCYLIFTKEQKAIFKLFNNAIIGHQSTAFIELNRTEGSVILIEMHSTHLQLMHVKNNQFKIFNCFTYENVEDLLYYVTYSLRQLKVEKEAQVELAGWITENDPIYKRLKEYLPNIKIKVAKSPLDSEIIPINQHHHFNQVTRQHLCV